MPHSGSGSGGLPTSLLAGSYAKPLTPSPHPLRAHQPAKWACRCLAMLSVITLHSCHWAPTCSGLSPLPYHSQLWTLTLDSCPDLGPWICTLGLTGACCPSWTEPWTGYSGPPLWTPQEGHCSGPGQFHNQHPIMVPHMQFIFKMDFFCKKQK